VSTAAGDFARVLAEAGEPDPAELPPGERQLAELRARVAELNAGRMARWLRNEAPRRAGLEAYQRANAAAGIEGPALDHFPWMGPPAPVQIW